MKHLFIITLFLLIPALAQADSGIIVESKGKVTITAPGSSEAAAKAGAEFADGSLIKTSANSSAVIFFKNGVVKRLGANQTVKAKGTPKKADETLFAGLASATKDLGKKGRGPTAHMAVKKVGGSLIKPAVDQSALNRDLAKIDNLKLSPEGSALLKAEVYKRYNQLSTSH